MAANIETMAYHGKLPWHRLGTPVKTLDKRVELAAAWQ